MARYHATVDTRWPVERAFAYMAAFDNTRKWDPGVASARPATDAAPGPDSVFHLDFRVGPRTIELIYRIVAFDAPHAVTLLSDNSPIISRDQITVEPIADGSRITYDAELTLKGLLRFADPLLGLGFHRAADRALAGLTREVAAD